MVCKRSLYCWKNGPCASNQTRKQIWEDNIKFRENLRDLNQSDSFWSFQISKNSCLCLEEEEFFCGQPLSRKYRTASLPRLHQIDCASVTHDLNGLKTRNCFVHGPVQDVTKSSENKRADTPVPQSLSKKSGLTNLKNTVGPLHKSDEDAVGYCRRYKNTLTNGLKPNTKTKFASQSNLHILSDKSLAEKKSFHVSSDNVNRTQANKNISPVINGEKAIENEVSQLSKQTEKTETKVCVEKEKVKTKKPKKELKPAVNFSNKEGLCGYTPVSRTTRKMLKDDKQIPFLTYGCNNNNLDIGSKRTHNVFASKMEVYPNALSAKQQKRDLIMKHIQSEKDFQRKCAPDFIKRRLVNHSSLWSLDKGKENNSGDKGVHKYSIPVIKKPSKKLYSASNQPDPFHYKTYRKPQIFFY